MLPFTSACAGFDAETWSAGVSPAFGDARSDELGQKVWIRDFQMVTEGDVEMSLEGVPARERQMILVDNARKVYKL